jgi:hypothetical protein
LRRQPLRVPTLRRLEVASTGGLLVVAVAAVDAAEHLAPEMF